MLKYLALTITVIVALSSCNSIKHNENKQLSRKQNNAISTPQWEYAKHSLLQLPQQSFHDDFYMALETFLQQHNKGIKLLSSIHSQLQKNHLTLPVFNNFPMPLQCKSIQDNYNITYTLQAPENIENSSHIFIVLDEYERFPESLDKINAWKIFVPSRPHMNYQLTAESDLWQVINNIQNLYPLLQGNHSVAQELDQLDPSGSYRREIIEMNRKILRAGIRREEQQRLRSQAFWDKIFFWRALT